MSKIAISVAEPCHNPQAISLVRSVTGLGFASIRQQLAAGKTGIFYTAELYMNNHLEVDQQLRKLIAGFEKLGIAMFIMEIAYEQFWQEVYQQIEDLDEVSISTNELLGLLDSWQIPAKPHIIAEQACSYVLFEHEHSWILTFLSGGVTEYDLSIRLNVEEITAIKKQADYLQILLARFKRDSTSYAGREIQPAIWPSAT